MSGEGFSFEPFNPHDQTEFSDWIDISQAAEEDSFPFEQLLRFNNEPPQQHVDPTSNPVTPDPSGSLTPGAAVSQHGQQHRVPQELGAGSLARGDNNWTYCCDVWPASDLPGQAHVSQHTEEIHKRLVDQELGFILTIGHDATSLRPFRRFWLPRRFRDNERMRGAFFQVFSLSRSYNKNFEAHANYRFRMSVGYEAREYIHDDSYSAIGGPDHGVRGDPFDDVAELTTYVPPTQPTLLAPPGTPPHDLATPPGPPQGVPTPPTEPAEVHNPARSKPIPKPLRDVTKNPESGKYVCSWPNCTEEVKEFNRKCEWSKHMDKHDRPYKCPAPECDKLPGFTYSGGLLRHEREVHGKHGGPKNPLNCPHLNCKRNSGKGFSRLENLNEHLRRVHTQTPAPTGSVAPEDQDDNLSLAASDHTAGAVQVGEKRKADDQDLRQEVKRLQLENKTLADQVHDYKNETEALKRQQARMMQEMNQLQQTITALAGNSAGLPSASLLEEPHSHFG